MAAFSKAVQQKVVMGIGSTRQTAVPQLWTKTRTANGPGVCLHSKPHQA